MAIEYLGNGPASVSVVSDGAYGDITVSGIGTIWTVVATFPKLALANVFTNQQTISKDDAVTNAVTDILKLSHTSSGTVAASFGVGLLYQLENAAGTSKDAASVDAVWIDATDTSEDTKLSFKTMVAGAAKAERGYVAQGLVMGAPTGGDKGAGTVNTTGVYINGSPVSSSASPGAPDVIVEDQKALGSAGGAFQNAANRTRTLNTLVRNSGTLAALAANQVTLPAGTYYFQWSAPAYNVDNHQTFLYNVTGAAEIGRGTAEFANNGGAVYTRSSGSAVAVLSGATAIELRHRCTSTQLANGFGQGAGFGTEVFARLEIWRIA